MEIRFQNTSTYTLEAYKKFIEFHNRKYNFKYNAYTFFIICLCLFCMVLQFRYGNIGLGILFILILVGFIFYRILHPLFFIKKEANSSKIKNQTTNIYTFYDDFVIIKSEEKEAKLSYYKFYKVFETKDRFYLYLNKNYAYILFKNNFSIGESKQFMPFMKKKLWHRF